MKRRRKPSSTSKSRSGPTARSKARRRAEELFLKSAQIRLLEEQRLPPERARASVYGTLPLRQTLPVSLSAIKTAKRHGITPTLGKPLLVRQRHSLRQICKDRDTRRSVLLSIGKVSKSGGAPGPYRKPKPSCK